jgi:hypothetical protein
LVSGTRPLSVSFRQQIPIDPGIFLAAGRIRVDLEVADASVELLLSAERGTRREQGLHWGFFLEATDLI